MKCEICNNKMKEFKQGATVGWKCCVCGNNLLTTLIPEIESDQQIYEIFLRPGNEVNVANIKLISEISNCNFLSARKSISNAESIKKDVARIVRLDALALEGAKIKFKIKPEFPYSLKSGEVNEVQK